MLHTDPMLLVHVAVPLVLQLPKGHDMIERCSHRCSKIAEVVNKGSLYLTLYPSDSVLNIHFTCSLIRAMLYNHCLPIANYAV